MDKKMKIAMIGHKRIPSREGGVEIVVEELATRMVKDGYEVHAYNRGGSHVAGNEFNQKKVKEFKGVRILTIPTVNKKSLNALLYSFFATIRALFGKYDVIHYHAEGPCAMLVIPHIFGIKTIATIHGLDWQRSKWGGFATKYLKYGEKMAAKYADEVIVLSENVKKYFKDTYNRDVNYIENGVNIPEQKPCKIIGDKFGLERGKYILFLARIVPEKGLHYLIEAYKKIDTDIKLVIAGSSSHSNDYCNDIVSMVKDDDRIVMTGFVQGDELNELFSNCFMYVLPSDIEGMPLSLLEAMSYGCKCLVSDIPENLETIQGHCDVFKHSDVISLRQKLEEALSQEFERKNDNIQYVKERYNWDEITDRTLQLYQKIVGK